MNLYEVKVILTIEAEDADHASDRADDFLSLELGFSVKDYEIRTIRTFPLVREDSP